MKTAQLKPLQHLDFRGYSADKKGNVYFKDKKQKLTINKKGYLVFRIRKNVNKKSPIVYAHRFIVECWVGKKLKRLEYIDHINYKKTDNSFNNLRIANNSENLLNHNRLSGLNWDKNREKWRVTVTIPNTGKSQFIGRFKSKQKAILMCKKYKKELK